MAGTKTKELRGLTGRKRTRLKGFLQVEGYGYDFGKNMGLFAKWWRPRMFDQAGAGSQPWITDRTAGVNRMLSCGGGSVDRGVGLIQAIHRGSGG
jgi:hypothetical protein